MTTFDEKYELELEPSQLICESQLIYEELESKNWAPWLRFSPEELAEHRSVFPRGQITLYDIEGIPKASLDTVRISWSGDVEDLTTWDLVAGRYDSYSETHDPSGNTVALLSMSVREDAKGEGCAKSIIETLKESFLNEGVEYIIGDFRPTDFGKYKSQTKKVDFVEYINERRNDGQFIDGWLRSIEKSGGQILKPDPRAMVIKTSLEEFGKFQQEHSPEKWWSVNIHSNEGKTLIDWHEPLNELQSIDEVWECGEAGTWYVDASNNEAVYIESNVWGQLPLSLESFPSDNAIDKELIQGNVSCGETLETDYQLSSEKLNQLEKQLVNEIKANFNNRAGIFGAWIDTTHEYSNIIRTLEAKTPEFKGIESVVDDSVETRSKFFALIDTRNGADRIIHATRISGEIFNMIISDEDKIKSETNTGFIAINELLNSGQNFKAMDFHAHCEEYGINLNNCVGVETNFTVGERTQTDIPGLRVSDLGYIAIFLLLESKGLEPGKTSVFAFVNQNTINSMSPLGFLFEPIAGRPDLRVPGTESQFSDDFRPVRIPITDDIVRIYDGLRLYAAEELEITSK